MSLEFGSTYHPGDHVKMQVPFVDLRAQYDLLKPSVDEAIQRVIDRSAFIGGEEVQAFEQEYAQLFGVKHCISTANGTDSLYIVLKMLGIGPGDEVITVANSWISTSETISQTGARVVFCDIEPDYFTIDPVQVERLITKNTKAIVPVHLYGQSCNMDALTEISDKFDIPIVEDCAQSHLAEFRGKRTGLYGVAGSFSFYPGKNLGAYGDAGCIITNDDALAMKFRMFARHGALKKHNHEMEGINSRMDGLQAAVLRTKLPYLESWTAMRQSRARLYDEWLSEIPQVHIPIVREHSTHVYHLYVIRTDHRDQLAAFLSEKGIQTGIHYPTALPNQPAYGYLGHKPTDFPIASEYQSKILSLPMYPELSESQVQFVCDAINTFSSA